MSCKCFACSPEMISQRWKFSAGEEDLSKKVWKNGSMFWKGMKMGFNVLISGKTSLYNQDRCPTRQIAPANLNISLSLLFTIRALYKYIFGPPQLEKLFSNDKGNFSTLNSLRTNIEQRKITAVLGTGFRELGRNVDLLELRKQNKEAEPHWHGLWRMQAQIAALLMSELVSLNEEVFLQSFPDSKAFSEMKREQDIRQEQTKFG